ncbi:hypothetical protein [Ancylomarina sp.]|uniref:hypothetical protein n=1 Tax=Ancylomarina sp. TaxID=1970196 RepID=UPI0035637B1E
MKAITTLVTKKRGVFEIGYKFHLVLFFLFLTCSSFASSFHVAVDGSPNGDGSEFSPWDLNTALSHPSTVLQGDTIWLHAGVYKGHFTSTLNGAEGANIVVRQFPGEKAIIDGVGRTGSAVLSVKGSYTIYWGFTVTDSNTNRISQIAGSFASDIPNATGVNVLGSYNKIINVIVHDAAGNGIGAWASGVNTEVYGCISYYNGWQGPDRGHGHAFYSQNEDGTKVIENNIFFHNFNKGIQVYTSSSSIRGYHIEGNSIFNNGIISRGKDISDNILIGGGQPADRLVITDNYTYITPSVIKTNVRLGYDVANDNVIVKDNYLMGGFPVLRMNNWKSVEFIGNTIVGNGKLIYLEVPSGVQSSSYEWDYNTYYAGGITKAYNENAITFEGWKQTYSIDQNSQYTHAAPSGTKIFKRPNKYEPGRSSITIFNRDLNNSISVDLSDLIEDGANYEIFDVENLNQGPLLAGVYKGGSIDIPMNLTATTSPNGNVPVFPSHTGLEFGVYLIISSPCSENDNYYTRNKETVTEK